MGEMEKKQSISSPGKSSDKTTTVTIFYCLFSHIRLTSYNSANPFEVVYFATLSDSEGPHLVGGWHLICHSHRENSHSRLVGAGFSGAGVLGDKAARQRSRVYLRVELHNCLF